MTSKRTKGITVRLSEKEYQKIEQLADTCLMFAALLFQ